MNLIKTIVHGLFLAGMVLTVGHPVLAQNAPAGAPQSKSDDQVVELSPFAVSSTQDTGYVTNRSPSSFKMQAELIKIPQNVMVMTRDMITDLGYASRGTDALRFVGVSNFSRGELMAVRGVRLGYNLIDEHPEIMPIMDNVFVDSYEVIRGSANSFYPTSSVRGVVLKTTRKPLPRTAHSLKFEVDQWGLYRSEIDTTGPIALADRSLSYRVIGAYQDGETPFKNTKERIIAFHPSLQFTKGPTSVLLGIDFQTRRQPTNDQSVVDAEGKLYTGAGRDEGWMPRDNDALYRYRSVRLQGKHAFSDAWQVKSFAMVALGELDSSYTLPTANNFVNMTRTFGMNRIDDRYMSYNFLLDVAGNWSLFGRAAKTIVGGTAFQRTNDNDRYVLPAGITQSWIVPMANPNMNAINKPSMRDWIPAPQLATRAKQLVAAVYWAQTLEVIKDRLTLSGAITWKSLDVNSYTDITKYPRNGVNTFLDAFLKRYGAVFEIIPGQLSVYAVEAEDVSPRNATARDAAGNLLPDVEGKAQEVGIKTDFLQGRVVSTVSVFKIVETGQSVLMGVVNGQGVFTSAGTTENKGWDMQLAWKPKDNWQVIATYYDGDTKDQKGARLGNSFHKSWSLFTRYDFTDATLKGLTIGGGAVRISDRIISNNNIFPAGVSTGPITLKPGNQVDAFARYRLNSRWTVSASVKNILDDAYAVGAQLSGYISASNPRTFSTSIIYTF